MCNNNFLYVVTFINNNNLICHLCERKIICNVKLRVHTLICYQCVGVFYIKFLTEV
jgi:hypothetical protein